MSKNNESIFYKSVGELIEDALKVINTYSAMIEDILPNSSVWKDKRPKVTIDTLLQIIENRFGEGCMTDRTLKHIKKGDVGSSAYKVMLVINTLNYLIGELNMRYEEHYNKPLGVNQINLNSIKL